MSSRPDTGPMIFDTDGRPTHQFLHMLQDGSLHQALREKAGLPVQLAPDFTADTDRLSSPGTVPIPEDYEFDLYAYQAGLHDTALRHQITTSHLI